MESLTDTASTASTTSAVGKKTSAVRGALFVSESEVRLQVQAAAVTSLSETSDSQVAARL